MAPGKVWPGALIKIEEMKKVVAKKRFQKGIL
jgi:hypothetical protein